MQNPEKLLQRLDWTVIRRLDGLLQGDYRTLFHGAGLDLAELREYQFSDDVRYIDWNVTARLQTPYVRIFTEDREMTAWFLLDLSPSVDFGTVSHTKRDLLLDYTGVLARLLTRRGNRVGAILYSGKIELVMPPRNMKNHVLTLLKAIQSQPYLEHSPETDLSVLLHRALDIIHRRSFIFVISDFFSRPGWERPLGMLGRRHEVLAVRLYDPSEYEIPDMGFMMIEDAETGQQMFANTHDGGFRSRFKQAVGRHEYSINLACRRAGVDQIKLATDGDLVRDLVRYATLRKRRKAMPASFARTAL